MSKKSDRSPRAVIDIGSNTVRLVVYGPPRRAPTILLNEKVTARLGRALTAEGGELPRKAMDQALTALARFAVLLRDMDVADIQMVATAATRDSANGRAFLDEVAALGLAPRQLSGQEEARAAAQGVIAAFPDARGIVADLGGGSLELIEIAQGDCLREGTFALGTLRLPELRKAAGGQIEPAIRQAIAGAAWDGRRDGRSLYLVGGTWRAFASFAMCELDWPLSDPHGFTLSCEDASKLARKAARTATEELARIPGISAARAAALPDAADLLRVLLDTFEPSTVIASSWGLREGLLYQKLNVAERSADPLLDAVIAFAAPRHGEVIAATRLAAWTAGVAGGQALASERLRLAATMLSLALAKIEPNLRSRQAAEWALDKRWVGIDPSERAILAAALMASCGKTALPQSLSRLASEKALARGVAWGLGIRLARRVGVANLGAALSSALTLHDGRLQLALAADRAAIAGEIVSKDLALLAAWVGAEPVIGLG